MPATFTTHPRHPSNPNRARVIRVSSPRAMALAIQAYDPFHRDHIPGTLLNALAVFDTVNILDI